MKNARLLFVTVVALGLAVVARGDLLNGISIVVNDSVVTYAEIQDGVMPSLQALAGRYAGQRETFDKEAEKVREDEIEELVERQLILHEFYAGGYATNVLEAFVDDSIKAKIAREFYNDRARLIKTLQANGMTYEMFRQREKETFILQYMNYHNGVSQKVIISPLKIELYYNEHKDEFKVDDQVKLRMIVITNGPDNSAPLIAREILNKIESGVPFEEMASVYTSGAQRANGGDRGWVDKTYFRPELAKVAFSLTAGQHSGVVELPEACYLMLVEDRKEAHVRPMSEVHSEIEQNLIKLEGRRLHDRWIERLKTKSFISFY
jgi:parvulin-like peptidyl-prolyl isomerase